MKGGKRTTIISSKQEWQKLKRKMLQQTTEETQGATGAAEETEDATGESTTAKNEDITVVKENIGATGASTPEENEDSAKVGEVATATGGTEA